ncbi:MAG TPA: hypothetical protein VHV26_07525 [Rhizomicrobium sp.]|jgi:hypothetical protein|nr:hypothetical protein [Rhizomicrobium sp.]
MLSKSAYIIIAVVIVVLSFGATMFALNYWSGSSVNNAPGPVASTTPSTPPAATRPPAASAPATPSAASVPSEPAGPAVTQDTTLAEIPSDPAMGFRWTNVRGLNIQTENGASVATAQPVLRMIATPNDTVHSLFARFTGLNKNQVYRITAWLKPIAGGNAELDAFDQPDGNPVNSASVFFSPSTQSVVTAAGAKAQGIDPASDGWQKAWLDLATTDGQFALTIRVAKDASNTFKGDGKMGLMFGGLQVAPSGQ